MKKGWPTKTLGEVCQFRGGGTPSKAVERYWLGEIPWVSPKDMKFDVISDSIDHISHEAINRSPTSLIPKDSVLMVVRSGILARTVPIAITGRALTINQDLKALCPNGAVDVRFLYHLLISKMDVLLSMVSRGATVHRLMTDQIRALGFILPPLPEQQRIVGILDQAFAGIATAKANAEKNLQNARDLFESHLQSIFTQRGAGWIEKRLGDICERVSVGHVGPTSEFYCEQIDGISFLRSQNVRRGFLDWNGIQYITKEFHQKLRKSQLRGGDLLFVRVGANRGDCCSLPHDAGEINCANIVFARPTQGNANYLARYCDSAPGREQLLGMTTGSAQGVINTHSVADLVVPIPPPLEQKRIVDSLNDFQIETRRLESIYQQKLAALDELKKSLLHQAFSGQL